MKSRFSLDLEKVRIHTGPRAARSARSADAEAYTVGNHVVFNEGRYQPDSPAGERLLAHELAHVAQNQTDASSQTVVRRKPDQRSWSQKLGEAYDETKWKAYRGLIAAFKSAKNVSMNGLRRLVPQLPATMQSAIMSIIDGADFCCDLLIGLMLAIIGITVGFVEGIVQLVTGILKMAYGLLKLFADAILAIAGYPDRYGQDLDGIVAAVKAMPAALSKVIDEWLTKYKRANPEDQLLMGSELIGGLEAAIASFAFTPGKGGQAANLAERSAAAVEDAGAGAVEKASLADAPAQAAADVAHEPPALPKTNAVAGPLEGATDAEIDEALNNLQSSGERVELQPHGRAATSNRNALQVTGKEVQSAHGAPQSVMKGVAGYNPNSALTKLLSTAEHTAMDQFWKETFMAMQRAGIKQATAQQVFDIVAESIRRAPTAQSKFIGPVTKGMERIGTLTPGMKSSLISRLSDEMFVEYGLRPTQVLDLPYANLAP